MKDVPNARLNSIEVSNLGNISFEGIGSWHVDKVWFAQVLLFFYFFIFYFIFYILFFVFFDFLFFYFFNFFYFLKGKSLQWTSIL